MGNMLTFKDYLSEGVKLTPAELRKNANSGPNEGQKRIDILASLIKNQTPIKYEGGEIVVANVPDALKSIEVFRSAAKPKAFELKGTNGETISSSKLIKTVEFGGGGGGSAGPGSTSTAIGESAQCVWLAAMLAIGYDKPIESFTDDVLKDAFSKVSVGKTKLDKILSIDEGWKKSSYLTAQYLIKNGIVNSQMTFHRDDDKMKKIYALKGKAFKNSGLSVLKDDKWNPGDIWAIGRGFDVSRDLDASTVETLNDDILDAYLQSRLVGISLKKVSRQATSVEKNIERPPVTNDYKYIECHIKGQNRGDWYTSKQCNILFMGGLVEVRADRPLGVHKCEIKLTGARGGSASWGAIVDAAKTIYRKKMPDTSKIVREAKAIVKGDAKMINKFTTMLNVYDQTISKEDVIRELSNIKGNKEVWVHGKLGSLYVITLLRKGGLNADKFVTQIVNYAGSSSSQSSAYIILKDK